MALSATCFAAMPVFARAVYADGVDPGTLLLLRFTLAAAVLLAVAWRQAAGPCGGTLAGMVLLGGLYVGQSLTYFVALTMTSVALLGLLLYLYPVAVAVLASLVFAIPLTRTRRPVAGAGAEWRLADDRTAGQRQLAGHRARSGFGADLFRVYPRRDAPYADGRTGMVVGDDHRHDGDDLCRPGGRARRSVADRVLGWAAIVAIALVSTVVAILSFMAGLKRVGPTDAATLSTLEPAMTAVLAVVLLGERLGPLQILGGGLIVSAALVVARSDAPAVQPVPVA